MTAAPATSNLNSLNSTPVNGTGSAIVGLQWGDEGKGKVIDIVAAKHDAVVRYNGGANAGHSVVVNGERFALHLVPCGVFHQNTTAVIGNGVVVDPVKLIGELAGLKERNINVDKLFISDRAHVVMPYHMIEDGLREDVLDNSAVGSPKVYDQAIGTTKRGIGPAYSEKAARSTAVRVGDLLRPEALKEKLLRACYFKNALMGSHGVDEHAFDHEALTQQFLEVGQQLKPFICDTTYLMHEMLRDGKSLLFEGANATLLDVDHGTYPFVTSSNCSVLGIPSGTGLPPKAVQNVTGVLKAYSTRVGGGPFPTELDNEIGDQIRKQGNEFGTTTGRPRRCGWLDLVAVRYSAMVNGVDSLGVMLLDVLTGLDELKVCTAYELPDGTVTERFIPDANGIDGAKPIYQTLEGWQEDITGVTTRDSLPDAARKYIDFIEEAVAAPVGIISVGPDRAQTIAG